MYNIEYIKQFDTTLYDEYLNNPSFLDGLKNDYNKKYTNESNANTLVFKEDLDHYVAKQLMENPNFINSSSFKNYCTYLSNLINTSQISYNNNSYYSEINSNILFNNSTTREIIIDRLGVSRETIINYKRNNKNELQRIYSLMESKNQLTQGEIIYMSDYIYNTRNVSHQVIDVYLKYVFNDLPKTTKPHPAISGALLSCFAQIYDKDEKVNKNSRFFVAEKAGNGIKIALSNDKYCAFQKSYLDNLDLFGCESLNISRTSNHCDVYWLMMVSFHELTHQYQANERDRKTLSSSGLCMSIRNILRNYMPQEYSKDGCLVNDYKANHDKDEIELNADEEAWAQTRKFINKYIEHDNRYFIDEEGTKKTKWEAAVDNGSAINIRRTFSMKKDVTTLKNEADLPEEQKSSGTYYAIYDIKNLIKIVKEHPEALNAEPSLKAFFNQDGSFNPIATLTTNLLHSDNGTTHHQNNSAYELYAYTSYNYGLNIYNEINNKGISEQDANNLIHSLRYVYWGGKHKFEDFNKLSSGSYDAVDIKQYVETKTGFDFNNEVLFEKTFLYHYYVTIVGMVTERNIFNLIKSKYPNYNIKDVGTQDYMYYLSTPLEYIKNNIRKGNDRYIKLTNNPRLLEILEYAKKLHIPEVDALVEQYKYQFENVASQGEQSTGARKQ